MRGPGKRLLAGSGLLLLAALATAPHAAGSTNGTADAAAPFTLPFPVGETLLYRVYWGFIPVGTTQITSAWTEEEGARLLHIRYRTRSNKVIAKLYPVDDVVEAFIDPATFRPVRFIKNNREGRHRHHEITTFDYTRGEAQWISLTRDRIKALPIDADTRDLISFMYLMRAHRFAPGDERAYRVMADDKIYDLGIRALKEETLNLEPFGKVPCIRLEPVASFNGLFMRKGRMDMWVSRDTRSLCTKVTAQIPVIADVRAVLVEVKGPGNDRWVNAQP